MMKLFKKTGYVFLATRLPLILLALFFIGFADPGRNISLFDAFSNWDGQWYLRVAKEGYHWQGPSVQANVAFFPLYPLFGKLLSLITGNLALSFFIVSNVSFFIFLLFFYKIAREHLNNEASFRSIWYLSIFPLSFVFSVFYSESLFFALTAGSIYFAYRKKWNSAVIFAVLSTLTRLSGLVLLPTLLYYYLRSEKKRRLSVLLKILVIPAGALFFSLYLKFKTGDFLAFLHVLSAWHILWQNPLSTVVSAFKLLSALPKYNYFVALSVFDLTALVFFILLLLLSYKRLPKELFLYSLLIFIFNVCKSWDPSFFYPLGSTNRYLFEAFPLFLVLGKFGKNKLFGLSYTVFSLLLLSILSLSFFSGKWVF